MEQDSLFVDQSTIYGTYSLVDTSPHSLIGIDIPVLRNHIAIVDFTFILSIGLFVLLIALLFVFRSSIRQGILAFVRWSKYGQEGKVFSMSSPVFKVLLLLFSFLSFSLFVFSLFSFYKSVLFSFPWLFFVLLCYFIVQIILGRVMGLVTKQDELFTQVGLLRLYLLFVVSLFIVPLLLLVQFISAYHLWWVLPFSLFLVFIALLFFYLTTLKLFLLQKVAVLLWFLYFCTIEILPIIVFFKFLYGL